VGRPKWIENDASAGPPLVLIGTKIGLFIFKISCSQVTAEQTDEPQTHGRTNRWTTWEHNASRLPVWSTGDKKTCVAATLYVCEYLKQIALLSQRGRAMLCVCHYFHYNTSTASSASDLTLRTLFCSVFVVVVHAAGCDKYRFTSWCVAKGARRIVAVSVHRSSTSSIDSQASYCRQSRFVPSTPAFDAPVIGLPSDYYYGVWRGKTTMVWLPDAEKIYSILYRFSII